MSLVKSDNYLSNLGRKPSSPAFLYRMHPASGANVPCAFGNGDTLVLQGTEGTTWATRGQYTPPAPNSTVFLRPDSGGNYARTVLTVDEVGSAFIVFLRLKTLAGNPGTENNLFNYGRTSSTGSFGALYFNETTGGALNFNLRGTGAGGIASDGGGLLPRSSDVQIAVHVEMVDVETVRLNAFIDGVATQERELLWTYLGATAPLSTSFTSPGSGLMIGARGNTATTTTFVGFLNGTAAEDRGLYHVGAVKLPNGPSMSTAQALALELTQYPRYVGEILAGL